VMALPDPSGGTVVGGFVAAGLGMGIQSPALLVAVVGGGGSEGRDTSSVPLARTVGGGIGIAIAGTVLVAVAGTGALEAAEATTAAVPAVADGARAAFLTCAAVSALALPALRLLPRGD